MKKKFIEIERRYTCEKGDFQGPFKTSINAHYTIRIVQMRTRLPVHIPQVQFPCPLRKASHVTGS